MRHHQGMPLHSSQFVFAEEDNIQLVSCKAKPNKMVLVLSSLHAQISVQEAMPFKHTAILDYNMTKGGIDVMDHMKSEYAVKCKSLRWHVAVFLQHFGPTLPECLHPSRRSFSK